MAGKVILVGAGPGDPGLMTLKGRRALERAEVVVYDRLVDEELLTLIPAGAERIDVGKNAGNHPVPQHEINRILLEKAQEGRQVVRLKGGDCFVFGRGGEELELLAANGIDFQVVPGITSALAAPAYAGIPATHRDFCASVHVITGHRRRNEALTLDYEALVRMNGTLIFLMSVSTFGEIAEGLMTAGMAADFPCAIVENGTRPEQRKWLTTVGGAAACIAQGVQSPAIFVVGRVCGLSDTMDWFDRLPLKGKRILVPRPRPDSHRLAEMLSARGARVVELPAPSAEYLPMDLPCAGERLVLTAAEAVDALLAAMQGAGLDARALAGCELCCVGQDAMRGLQRYGLKPDWSGEIDALDDGGSRLLCREDETQRYAGLAPRARICAAWRVRQAEMPHIDLETIDFAAFTTLSSVLSFAQAAGEGRIAGMRAVCIGARTAEAARKLGMDAVQSEKMTLESVAERLEELCRG